MKTKLLTLLLCTALIGGCTKDDTIALLAMQEETGVATTRADSDDDEEDELLEMHDTTMILGKQLENPYSVVNMAAARKALIASGTPASMLPIVKRTHRYVRFKPANDDELKALHALDTTIVYYEYPLDYEIVQNGVSYHDPSITDTLPTYQYAAISDTQWNSIADSLNVEYAVLEDLCIIDEDSGAGGVVIGPINPDPVKPIDPIVPIPNPGDTTRLNSITPVSDINSSMVNESVIDMLMAKSFELTGNEYEGGGDGVATYASKWRPAGTIRAYDDVVGDYVPLEGVRVRARRWFTTHKGTTDANGHFSCNGRFRRRANYSIVWDTRRYNIRDRYFVQAYYNGPKIRGDWNLDISGGKSVRYATIHRAAWRFYYGDVGGLSRPGNSRKENIAYIHGKGNNRWGDYNRQWGMGILQDIRIYGKDYRDKTWLTLHEIFATTCHELGHAAHYTRAKSNYKKSETRHLESWARFVEYYLTKLEYEALGAYNGIGRYDYEDNVRLPDDNHNRQQWRRSQKEGNYGLSTYTPLYIDLFDDFNQQTFYFSTNRYYYEDLPNDDITLPVSILEPLVFNSRSFSEVKHRLLEYSYSCSDTEIELFGIMEDNIHKLFEYYE